MLEKNQVITLEIVDISNDGNGIGRYDGLAVFVPMAAVGDVCEVKILKVLSSYCFGKIDKILTPSKDRVASKCNNFSMCGGCDFWHINYAAEKAAKKNFVKSAFERIGKIDTPVNDTLSCEQPERYRNKAQFPVSNDKNGCATTGFFAQRSHRIIPCEDCLLQPVLLNRVAQALISLFNKYKIKAYDESSHLGNIRHIYLRYAQVTDQLMVCIVATSKNIAALDTITQEIVAQFPNIKTVVLNINSKDTNIILGQENILLYGDGIITDIICGVKTELSPHSFYQVNHDGAQQLYTLARNMLCLQKDDILLDMYCGAGTIGLSMAQEVYGVVGVEIVHQAIANAIKNAEINDIKNAKFICSDAKDAAEKLYADGFRPTAVVLDPARKGCDTETLNAIINMSPKRIAMISCNPSTAARDCKFLSENGYEIIEIQPYDMFPRTKHVEAIILMTYCGDKPKK